MPLPHAFRAVARRLNPAVAPIARRLAPLATVRHVGRRSGREFETPVMAFRTDDGWVVALVYGADVEWLRNVEAAHRATLTQRGRRIEVSPAGRIPHARAAPKLPFWARALMSSVGAGGYATFQAVEEAPGRDQGGREGGVS